MAAAAHNLPLQLSAFIGRAGEIAAIRPALARQRLVTLTGAGGAGKTRLALATAGGLLPDFAAGVWFVDFTPLADETLVAQAAATALGIREQPGRPLLRTLVDHLHERPALLIFDNCEHLVGACAQLAAALLQGCPYLRILATSREPLGVTGEVVWVVPPLSLPAPQPWHDPAGAQAALAAYADSEAVQLFVVRAMAAAPAFTLAPENGAWVAEICRRLDGMPLAIELAAARVRALSVREIAQRLDDRFRLLTAGSRTAPPRQQTLAATLDWSYRLLAEPEREVLQRLAVFAGGCTLAAAEAVCADDTLVVGEVLPVLSQLVDKSLVVAEQKEHETRYRLLETIRQYAREKLLQSGEAQHIQERHAAYFVRWAAEAESHLDGPDQIAWLARYEAEHDNLRAVLQWSAEATSRAAAGVHLAAACGRFWRHHAYLSEGSAHLILALAPAEARAPTATRAWALARLANLHYLRSDYPAVRPSLEEALAIWRSLGPPGLAGLAHSLDLLGELETEEGNYTQALVLFQEALDICRGLDDMRGVASILMQFGWAAIRTGEYAQAAVYLEEFLAAAQKASDLNLLAFAYSGLGEVALRQGEYARATVMLKESLSLNRMRGDKWGAATVLGSLGWVALEQGDMASLRAALGESLAIRMEIGEQSGIAWCLEKLAQAALLQGQAAAAPTRLERYGAAARIFGAAAQLRAPINSVIDPVDQPAYARSLATLRAGLGEQAFAAAWAKGAALPLPAAIAYALAASAPEPIPATAPDAPPNHPAAAPCGPLSARECEVAVLIAQGKSNREIAAAMTVGVKTVETYITRIFNKLGLDSRVQVATWALEQGLTTPSPPRT